MRKYLVMLACLLQAVSSSFGQNAPAAASAPANDYNFNWVLTRSYDENGNEIGATKVFFDNNGKQLQTQSKNESLQHVIATQPIYDLQGRAVLTTLPASTNNSAFAYKANFVTASNTPYSYLNFDGDPTNTSNPNLKLNAPDQVDNNVIGTLGWYYSNNNSFEHFVAATPYPYARADFYHDGTGAAKRSAGVDLLRMGSTHETTSNSFPVQNELQNYLAIRNQFFPTAIVGSSPTTMAGQALQTISTDQNGTSVLSVTDLSGKMSLMTARADATGSAWLPVTNTLSLSNVLGQYSFNITIGGPASVQGNTNDPAVIALMQKLIFSFGISTAYPVTVTCTSGGAATWTGIGNNYVPPQPSPTGSYSFVITSAYPFTISASNNYGAVYDQAEAQYTEPSGTSIQYFQLATPSAVTLTGSYKLYNMTSEADITTSFSNGSNLGAGYYKVIAVAPTTNTTNNVTVTYTNKYSDISYNYYNQLGQLLASIAPNGVQPLAQGNLSSLTFVTTYQYDLQGRLISSTSTDGGTSTFIYRQDGKIRFSQNSYQANSANAGIGNAEKFSYTNYDSFGRPVESGEYAVTTSGTFAGLSTNTTALEATDPTGGLPAGGTKLSQVNTVYDLPDPSFSLTGYVQDPGFLKGAVSYTYNVNSKTWYNYDDHGRVTWVVKQIAGLTTTNTYKTVNYTYDANSNPTVVDYQMGAPDEFIHNYHYDGDSRLISVQAGTPNNILQQANYYYYLHGPLKRVELGNQLQGIDYVYTAEGWLKAINSPTGITANDPMQDGATNGFAKDVFGLQLEYFAGDYNRGSSNVTPIPTGSQPYYNGTVTGMSWQSNKPATVVNALGASIQNPTMYIYTYDKKYQYTQSVWGAPNYSSGTFSPSANNMFQEKGIAYDANGNIMSMQHTDVSGNLVDNFSYNYATNTNQLTGVANAGAPNYGNYTYDQIGRLQSQVASKVVNGVATNVPCSGSYQWYKS